MPVLKRSITFPRRVLRARSARAFCLLLVGWLPAGASAQDPRGVAHAASWPQAHSVGITDAAGEAFITTLMSRMSLEEKVGQTIEADIGNITPQQLRDYPLGAVLAGGAVLPLTGDDRSAAAWLDTTRAFHDVALERRAGHTPIPLLFATDAVHGNNGLRGAVIFPHNIGLGAAHDAALVRRIGEATAQETTAVGMDWAFAPTVAVPQDLHWGRVYESYSQDPALVAKLSDALVRGLQGEPDRAAGHGLASGHVAASAKHFLGDGGTTHGIDQGDTDINEQTLIDVHVPGYVSAIDAGVLSVMVSYSSWQHRKMHANASLLTGVLKGQLGFDGLVVGDWNGHAQVPGCSNVSCAAALNAGLDMFMAPDGWEEMFRQTLAQVRAGTIPMVRLDDAVRRVLRVKLRLGMFESTRPWEGRTEVIGSDEHRALAREAVRRSLVLLKNSDRVLPIRASAHVLVAGDAADDIGRQCGGWSITWQGLENANDAFPIGDSIYAGLNAALLAGGGSAQLRPDGHYTQRPDVAVIVFGEHPYAESLGDVATLDYQHGSKQDLKLIRHLRSAHIPVVAVFLSGRPLIVDRELAGADAFVAAWLPGIEGAGVADVLIGTPDGAPRHDFSGTLSFAWPQAQGAPLPLGFGLRYR
jgi:beta-glucosidase